MRTPECKLCLVAAIAAAIILAGAALLGWVLPLAVAAPGVTFEPCSAKTCAKAGKDLTDALGAVGPIVIQADTVAGVAGVPGCPECTHIAARGTTKGVNVLGKPCDVACVLFGGDLCKSLSR